MGDKHLTIKDLAARWQLPVNTLYQWNSRGIGPRYLQIGRHVRYRVTDVEAWERAKEAGGSATPAA